MDVLGWLNGPFSGLKPKLAQNLTFLDWQIDFLGGPKAFLELECVTNNGMISEISIPLCVTNVQSLTMKY